MPKTISDKQRKSLKIVQKQLEKKIILLQNLIAYREEDGDIFRKSKAWKKH